MVEKNVNSVIQGIFIACIAQKKGSGGEQRVTLERPGLWLAAGVLRGLRQEARDESLFFCGQGIKTERTSKCTVFCVST